MPEPLAPQDIARRTFDVARRGYEQQEVRGFLHEVSAVVERLARAEQELRERAERAESRLEMADKPDEATLLEALGEETTRVLTSAREAANEIRTKAEESAARIISEATTEATETRRRAIDEADVLMAETREEREGILETARTELGRRTEEAEAAAARIRAEAEARAQTLRDEGAADLARAHTEAETVLEEARQQGRVMVAEAQAVRERILRDLAVRRKRARQQVEKLNAGRERLLSAYDVVRRTVDEATNELTVALTDARIAADAAARRIDDEPEPTLEQLDAEVSTAGLVDLPIADVDHHDDDSPGPFSGEVPAVDVSDARSAAEPDAGVVADDADASAQPDPAPLVAAAQEAEPPRPAIVLDDRRGRKGRRRKGFEGLPPGELSVVEPPNEGEGVRILAEPAVAPDALAPADEAAAEPATSEADESSPPAPASDDAPDASASGAPSTADPSSDGEPAVDHVAADAEPEETSVDETSVEAGDSTAVDQPAPDASAEPADEPDAPAVEGSGAGAGPASEDDTAATKSAAQVFARLRAGQDEPAPGADAPAGDDSTTPADGSDAASPAEAAPDVEAPPDAGSADAPAFAARREAIAPIERELARRLKRSLADEQNEVLDLLRRAKPKGTADLFPSAEEHASRWSEAAAPVLTSAAQAGASAMGGAEPSTTDDLAGELANALTAPLRERIDRSFTASDGNLDDVADRVRALYREWKGQRLTEAVQHYAAAAYAQGVFDTVADGARVRWVVDPAAGPCPDCDDNVLAGAIVKGEEFPTGNPCAPAHPGCHCLVLLAD